MALRMHSGMTCEIRSGDSVTPSVCSATRYSQTDANLAVCTLKVRLDAVMFGVFASLCACAPDVKADHYQRHHLRQKAPSPTQRGSLLVFSVRFILVPFLLAWSYTLQGSSLGKKNSWELMESPHKKAIKTMCAGCCGYTHRMC